MLDKSKYTRTVALAKVEPFGTRFLTKIENVNNKLTCNLSRAGADLCTEAIGTNCVQDRFDDF